MPSDLPILASPGADRPVDGSPASWRLARPEARCAVVHPRAAKRESSPAAARTYRAQERCKRYRRDRRRCQSGGTVPWPRCAIPGFECGEPVVRRGLDQQENLDLRHTREIGPSPVQSAGGHSPSLGRHRRAIEKRVSEGTEARFAWASPLGARAAPAGAESARRSAADTAHVVHRRPPQSRPRIGPVRCAPVAAQRLGHAPTGRTIGLAAPMRQSSPASPFTAERSQSSPPSYAEARVPTSANTVSPGLATTT